MGPESWRSITGLRPAHDIESKDASVPDLDAFLPQPGRQFLVRNAAVAAHDPVARGLALR